MSTLQALVSGISAGSIEVVDLTAPLSSTTPILKLPSPFADTVPFSLEEISRYDDRGPAWYWNNIHTGEHTGTHLDAPVHWVTAKDGADVSQIPARLPEPVEVAAYYVVSEALTNAAKHAHASVAYVDVRTRAGSLELSVRDDGAGGATPGRGSGLVGLTDRIQALGGTISVTSPADKGTELLVDLPIDGR